MTLKLYRLSIILRNSCPRVSPRLGHPSTRNSILVWIVTGTISYWRTISGRYTIGWLSSICLSGNSILCPKTWLVGCWSVLSGSVLSNLGLTHICLSVSLGLLYLGRGLNHGLFNILGILNPFSILFDWNIFFESSINLPTNFS